jgi:hypothetical protein
MDEQFCRQQLKTLREPTKTAGPFIKQRLINLAIRIYPVTCACIRSFPIGTIHSIVCRTRFVACVLLIGS